VKVGDLVLKNGGWGSTSSDKFTGTILCIVETSDVIKGNKVTVITLDGIEDWWCKLCEVINENR
jgi:hypothetical protein